MAITLRTKEEIRKQHPLYGQARIEVAHVVDKFKGGSNERTNLVPLTIPEHIVDHVSKAEQEAEWATAEIQYRAARLIVGRATQEEIDEANLLLKKRKSG